MSQRQYGSDTGLLWLLCIGKTSCYFGAQLSQNTSRQLLISGIDQWDLPKKHCWRRRSIAKSGSLSVFARPVCFMLGGQTPEAWIVGAHDEYGKQVMRAAIGSGFQDWGISVQVDCSAGQLARIL